MSENRSSWPPESAGSRGRHAPRGFQPPLPPGYTPVHHEPGQADPRLDGPRRPGDSPWRRAQRRSRPETAGWHQGGSAGHDGNPRGELSPQRQYGGGQDPRDRHGDPEPYGADEDDEGYDGGDRFVPGFGAYDDGDDRPVRRGGRAARHGSARRPGRDPAAPRGARGPRRRRFRWIAPLVALLVILVPVGIGGSYAYSLYMSKYHPADYPGAGTGSVVVQVSSGETPTSLGPKLVALGVVASARAFVLAAEHSSQPNGLVPGFYAMHKHMKASLAYARLLNPANLVQVTVTIPEGWRLSQIVAWLGARSGLPAGAYDKVLEHPAQLGLPGYADGKPEGYLFPATYEVQPHETALGVLTAMVQRFDAEAASVNLPAAARQVHLTQAQVVIMASLVQAEGGRLSDYPKIARVIDNRLAQGIPLQLDSTVLYGLNAYGIIASDSQLSSTSPYNTYRYKGLPPGPIDSPGNAAIQAVLHPAAGNWLYFVTVNPKTGETLFTSSQAQFEQFRAELEHNLGQG